MTKLSTSILDLLFPPHCAFCRKPVDSGENMLCPDCDKNLPYTGSAARQNFTGMTGCYSPLYYKDKVRDSLLRYKFGCINAYAPVYAKIIRKCIDENAVTCDIITWVPVSLKRLRRRGFDQSRLIAVYLSRLSCKKQCRLLKKYRTNLTQSSIKNREERKQNVKNAFKAVNIKNISGKKILLVDDIVTTGATLEECARVLLNAGASCVTAVTLARRED